MYTLLARLCQCIVKFVDAHGRDLAPSVTFEGMIDSNNLGGKYNNGSWRVFGGGNLLDEYLAANGVVGTYTTPAPGADSDRWTKRQ
nr:hypothetical protein [uncultured bacterium]